MSAHTAKPTRRGFLAGTAGVTAAAVLGMDPALRSAAYASGSADANAYPFTLGVASGDPDATSVVLWTRLTPDLLDPEGIRASLVPVRWEVYADETGRRRVASGIVAARSGDAHSVHVTVSRLAPGRDYWYRFFRGRHASPMGRTRTLPAPGRRVDRFAFAVASCQMYEHGHFTAYRHMAAEDLDLVLHLGDYIYEYGPNEYKVDSGNVRQHNGPEITSLADYRNRYALYHSDPDLQAAHAAFPFTVVGDDHEVDNNYAGAVAEDGQTREQLLARRAAAYQAFYEHMPVRRQVKPWGPDMWLYRRLEVGDLASISMLDTRQYRSDQACDDGSDDVPCGDWDDPSRTLLGERQERWLLDGLTRSRATWNILGQQVFFAERDYRVGEGKRLSMDGWDGYPAARQRVLDTVSQRGVDNFVVLTGDVHRHYAANVKANFTDAAAPVIGSEIVCSSITSGGDGNDITQDALTAESPHVLYNRNRRGYVRCTLDRSSLRADFLTLPYVSRPGAPIAVDASFVTEAGRPGLHRA